MNRIKTFNSPCKFILVVSVVASIFIFLNPTTYGIFDNNVYLLQAQPTKTNLSSYDRSLCVETPRPPKRPGECPKGGIITVEQGGRLGNQIWEYASVWAVAQRTGLTPYVPSCILDTLEDLFANLSVPALGDVAHCPMPTAEVAKTLEEWRSPNQSVVLPIYSRLFEEALPYLGQILGEFRLRGDVEERCQEVLRAAAEVFPRSTHTFVGVHVRRTDYAGYLRRKYQDPNITIADAGFFLRAMEAFEQRYVDAVFVVVSDDLSWCRKAFAGRPNVYLSMRRRSAVLDLALMASCNHTIYDYGTYGDWGSLLAGGETIYFDLGVNPSAQMGRMMPRWRTV